MGYILGFLAIMLVGAFVDGFVLKTLWAWFVVPTFTNLPLLTLVQATGISLVFEALTYHYTSTNKEDEWKSLLYTLLTPVAILAIGFIVRLFM